jgi:protein TonB
MEPFNEPLNEIIFEKRNKTYGAYVLRKEYADSLRTALLFAAAFAGWMSLWAVLTRKDLVKIPKLGSEQIIDTGMVMIIEPPVKHIDPEIEKKVTPSRVLPADGPKEVIDDPVETKAEEHTKQSSVTDPTQTGDDQGNGGNVDTDDGMIPETVGSSADDKPFVYVKEMPGIEGGILPYVKHHLNYPEIAKENRTSGTVYISFVVECDGSISNINILNNPRVGDGCEEEAIRVIKSAKWIPGKNNGRPVRVQLTLPVRYQIQ